MHAAAIEYGNEITVYVADNPEHLTDMLYDYCLEARAREDLPLSNDGRKIDFIRDYFDFVCNHETLYWNVEIKGDIHVKLQ
jgi:hypothetical protein